MKGPCWIMALALVSLASIVNPQKIPPLERPTASEHLPGPHGLEGWTLDSPIPDHPGERFPFTLVVARNGRIIRRIPGAPFVWKWIFWANGQQVAYETGSLHFNLQCNLTDVKTGRLVSSFDCFHGLPENAPEWAVKLEQPPQ